VKDVQPLPNNPQPTGTGSVDLFEIGYNAAIKAHAPTQTFDVTAVTVEAIGGNLIYNDRDPGSQLSTNEAVIYVRTEDLQPGGKVKPGVPIEPLILRAAAGDWIKVTLRNAFDPKSRALNDIQTMPDGTPFNNGPDAPLPGLKISAKVGLHPQLVGFDPINANGVIVGFNPKDRLVEIGKSRDFYWYAGEVTPDGAGGAKGKPIEFGATNLTSADQLLQPQFGMVGALIIEPQGSTWVEDATSRASATVTSPPSVAFREFVVIDQNMVANSAAGNSVVASVAGSAIGAINYRSEPFGIRGAPAYAQNLPQSHPQGYAEVFSNEMYQNAPAGVSKDPKTPIFVAAAGTPVRFRLLVPSTSTSNALNAPPVFIVHGHSWQEEPYIESSTQLGFNPLSESQGAVQGGVGQKFDILFPSAGGRSKIAGDYLYTTYQTAGKTGTWGLFRVTAAKVVIGKAAFQGEVAHVSGTVEKVAASESMPRRLRICFAADAGGATELGIASVAADGTWTFTARTKARGPGRFQATAMDAQGAAGAIGIAVASPVPTENLVTARR
jgi:hypothetical protein